MMKTRKTLARWLTLMILSAFCATPLLAHYKTVHERISAGAAQGATGLRQFLDDVLSAAEREGPHDRDDPNESPKSPVGWMQYGSFREDDYNELDDFGGIRVFNHFYDPITLKGLSKRVGSPIDNVD
jgi:hypothetical protein